MTGTDHNPEQKKILRLYGAFGAGLVLSLVPSGIAALVSMILFCGVLIAAYLIRTETEESSLTNNHMTFVIRTIWIGSFFAALTMTAGGIYLFLGIDHTPLNPCIQSLLNAMPDMGRLQALVEPCIDNYWATNKRVLIISGGIAAGPILLYFIIRYARGLSRALSGYRVANPRGWF